MKIIKILLLYPEDQNNIMKVNKNFKIKYNKKKTINSPIYLIFLYIFINYVFIHNTLSKEILLYSFTKINLDSEITMTIVGTGQQLILSHDYEGDLPDKIYVNNDYNKEKSRIVNDLNQNENNIRMVWYSPVTNCALMFSQLSNIKTIDFSKFDTSLVTDMYCMFYSCYS